jgi:hypothetical protein
MIDHPAPSQRLARAGFRPTGRADVAGTGTATPSGAGRRAAEDLARTIGRSPLVNILPPVRMELAGATWIAVPSGLVAPSGSAAWYGLRRLTIGPSRADLQLTAVAMTLLPPDTVGGAFGGSPLPTLFPFRAWGDSTGLGAAVVVGRNLPIEPNAWTFNPAGIPGIDWGGGGIQQQASLTSLNSMPDYIAVGTFPTGSLRDVAPNKVWARWNFQPHAHRVTEGQTLDVALVVRSGTVAALGADHALACYIDVQLVLGLTLQPTDFKQ